MASPPLWNSDHVVFSVSIGFPSNSTQDAPFHRIACDYSHADLDGLRDHLREVPLEDIFKCSASATARELCEWVQVETDVFIPHCKYQVKSHSSPWFSTPCAAAIAHRNHLFWLYQQITSSESKLKLRQASNRCKRVLEATKLAIANKKKKNPSLPRNLVLRTFGELLVVFLKKVNLLYLFYSVAWRCYLLYLIKQSCLLKTFLRNLLLMTQVSLYLFSLLKLIWNCIIFL